MSNPNRTTRRPVTTDTGVNDIMSELLAGVPAERAVDLAVADSEHRVTVRQVLYPHVDGALDLTGEAFPDDYAGIDDLTLAVTR